MAKPRFKIGRTDCHSEIMTAQADPDIGRLCGMAHAVVVQMP